MSKNKKIHIEWDPLEWELIVAIVSVVIVCFLGSYAIIAHTPVRQLIPGYPSLAVRQQMEQNQTIIDSLQKSIFRWELYSGNIRRILEGGKPVHIDSLTRQADRELAMRDAKSLAATDSLIRADIDEKERFDVSDTPRKPLNIDGLHFFKPVNGTVSHQYEIAGHPYLDITAPEGSTIKSVLDGSVIYTEWSEADLWCIVIQHSSGIISIYKHNRSVLKKVADKVSAGTAIAQLGSSSDSVKGSHLHFELWQDGTPLDPTAFITF